MCVCVCVCVLRGGLASGDAPCSIVFTEKLIVITMFFHHSGSFREAPLYHIYSAFNDMTSTKLTHEDKEARSVLN